MSIISAFKRYFDLEETVDTSEEDVQRVSLEPESRTAIRKKRDDEKSGRIVALQSARQTEKLILIEPRTFDDVESIVGHLKNRRIVLCNLHRVNREEGQRILDFVSGTLYALDGQIRKTGADTFLFAPDFVDISGVIGSTKDEKHPF